MEAVVRVDAAWPPPSARGCQNRSRWPDLVAPWVDVRTWWAAPRHAAAGPACRHACVGEVAHVQEVLDHAQARSWLTPTPPPVDDASAGAGRAPRQWRTVRAAAGRCSTPTGSPGARAPAAVRAGSQRGWPSGGRATGAGRRRAACWTRVLTHSRPGNTRRAPTGNQSSSTTGRRCTSRVGDVTGTASRGSSAASARSRSACSR